MSTKVIHAIFNDEEPLFEVINQLKGSHSHIREIYSPFPVHGLDHALGVPRTRIAICAFIYGASALLLTMLMVWYMMVYDWPQIFGGKPNFNLIQNFPAFVPIVFEGTVLCTAHGMALTFFLRSWLFPGVKAPNPDPRTTDDLFLMEIESEDQDEQLKEVLTNCGAIEIKEK